MGIGVGEAVPGGGGAHGIGVGRGVGTCVCAEKLSCVMTTRRTTAMAFEWAAVLDPSAPEPPYYLSRLRDR